MFADHESSAAVTVFYGALIAVPALLVIALVVAIVAAVLHSRRHR